MSARILVLLLALAAFSCAGARAVAAGVPPPSVVRDGAVTILEQNDPTSALVGTTFFLQAGRDRQTPSQNGLAALVAEAILSTPVSVGSSPALALRDAVNGAGGSIVYTVDGRDVRFYLEGLAGSYADMLLPLFAQALAKPDFSAAVLERARANLVRKIDENQRIALTVGIEMLDGAFYQGSDAGLPEFGNPATLENQDSAAARAFFAANYRRTGAVVSAAGDLAAVSTAQLERALDILPSGGSSAVVLHSANLKGSTHELVTHRAIPVPWLVAQFPAPPIGSRDFGPMLVLTTFLSRTLSDVAEIPTVATRPFSERGVGALYNFDARPANVVVYIDGGLGDPTRTFETALTVLNVVGHAKLAGNLDTMKAQAAGEFVNGATTLEDRSWLAGIFALRGVSPDYLDRAMQAIEKTTPADLQRVARTYFATPTIALILPRAENTAGE